MLLLLFWTVGICYPVLIKAMVLKLYSWDRDVYYTYMVYFMNVSHLFLSNKVLHIYIANTVYYSLIIRTGIVV